MIMNLSQDQTDNNDDQVVFPCVVISTVDCDCDSIKYKVVVCYDVNSNQEAYIDAVNLLPFLGRTIDLLNSHRVEADRQKEILRKKCDDIEEKPNQR